MTLGAGCRCLFSNGNEKHHRALCVETIPGGTPLWSVHTCNNYQSTNHDATKCETSAHNKASLPFTVRLHEWMFVAASFDATQGNCSSLVLFELCVAMYSTLIIRRSRILVCGWEVSYI